MKEIKIIGIFYLIYATAWLMAYAGFAAACWHYDPSGWTDEARHWFGVLGGVISTFSATVYLLISQIDLKDE